MFFRNTFLAGIASTLGLAAIGRMLGPPLPTQNFRKRSTNRGWKSRDGINPQNNTGWWRRNAFISPMVITERMLMRHGWYRRKLRTEGVYMKQPGNAVVLR
jgi:hypothetical protein